MTLHRLLNTSDHCSRTVKLERTKLVENIKNKNAYRNKRERWVSRAGINECAFPLPKRYQIPAPGPYLTMLSSPYSRAVLSIFAEKPQKWS